MWAIPAPASCTIETINHCHIIASYFLHSIWPGFLCSIRLCRQRYSAMTAAHFLRSDRRCAEVDPVFFLSDRTQQVIYKGQLSSLQLVQFGVPQGSVLGPLLYFLYTAEISYVVVCHSFQLHQYADDSQVYISISVNDTPTAIHHFTVFTPSMNG